MLEALRAYSLSVTHSLSLSPSLSLSLCFFLNHVCFVFIILHERLISTDLFESIHGSRLVCAHEIYSISTCRS